MSRFTLRFLLGALAILFVANLAMVYGLTNYPADAQGFIGHVVKEGFAVAADAAPAGDGYRPMGAYDGVRSVPAHGKSAWRYTAPDEPLTGPAPGPDDMFLFANNQCKPECCPSSLSCTGGCVCTTVAQRQFLASRGGNRTAPDDGA